jgi:hypothetical protein
MLIVGIGTPEIVGQCSKHVHIDITRFPRCCRRFVASSITRAAAFGDSIPCWHLHTSKVRKRLSGRKVNVVQGRCSQPAHGIDQWPSLLQEQTCSSSASKRRKCRKCSSTSTDITRFHLVVAEPVHGFIHRRYFFSFGTGSYLAC